MAAPCTASEMTDADPGSRKQLLFVDDEPDVLRALMRLLAPHVDVAVALNAVTALEALQKRRFDAVVTDFQMLGPSGAWLLREVRDKHPKLRRILFSGRRYVDIAHQLEPGLVHDYLGKPIAVDRVLELLD